MDFFDSQGTNQQDPSNFMEPNDNFGQFQEFNDADNQNQQQSDFIPLGGGNSGNNMGYDSSNQFDEAEESRIMARKQEENERRRKIEEKMTLELKLKEEYRTKAADYLESLVSKRTDALQMRKQQNVKNEQESMTDKQLLKEGKKNPWEKVTENINIKESDYKGTKNVSRMRSVIISRKNDYAQQNSGK